MQSVDAPPVARLSVEVVCSGTLGGVMRRQDFCATVGIMRQYPSSDQECLCWDPAMIQT